MDKTPKRVTRKTATTPAKKKKAPAKRTPSTATSKKKELVAKKRKKKLGLTVREQSLLLHPPTATTWLCTCDIANNGKHLRCWVCGKEQTSKLLWPIYEKACAKVGIEVGTLWRIKSKINGTMMIREPGQKWKEIELPEDTTF